MKRSNLPTRPCRGPSPPGALASGCNNHWGRTAQSVRSSYMPRNSHTKGGSRDAPRYEVQYTPTQSTACLTCATCDAEIPQMLVKSHPNPTTAPTHTSKLHQSTSAHILCSLPTAASKGMCPFRVKAANHTINGIRWLPTRQPEHSVKGEHHVSCPYNFHYHTTHNHNDLVAS